jgi:hypothetical protein
MDQATVRLKARDRYKHRGVMLKLNEEFDCDEAEAADLVALGMAVRVDEVDKPKRSATTYRRRDMKAE